MRRKNTSGYLSVNAVAGSYVVLLGMDVTEESRSGLLGFAIRRSDHTEGQTYWLSGFKTFEATDPGLKPNVAVSTIDQPVQAFLWGDYTAKPNHVYTYTVVAVKGTPAALLQDQQVSVDIATEDEDQGKHAIWFNRGVAGSQAYERKFHNQPPDKVPDNKAWQWLSRGLEEAMLAFIGKANGARFGIRAAVYEFQYAPVLDAFKAASDAKADVKIVYDDRQPGKGPFLKNEEAIKGARIEELCIQRRANSSYIAHNKFIVLLEDGKPVEVWTGSTNFTDGGIFGHSNVGHLVRDPDVAAAYLAYWQELSGDPEARQLRPWNQEHSPVPQGDPPDNTTGFIFSPRPSLEALEWYAKLFQESDRPVFFTAAFGVNDLFEKVLEEDKGCLRYVLLDKDDKGLEIIKRDTDNRIAYGAVLDNGYLGLWAKEKLTGLNTFVSYIHTKYMLIDPLGNAPVVISGSANFSNASTKNNDENMLVVRGDTRVADIYLGEFMRLFNQFFFRDFADRKQSGANFSGKYLDPTDGWSADFFKAGSPKQKERSYFAG
jgi:phosphatidylserine/phosphatidylglycerophosphate/cardiolipin synthase-like enzyme